MGQQQLLLVILVTIIVGIATVVAINVFGTAATEANRDAVRQDMLAAAAQAQAIYARPTMLNGSGGDFNTLTVPQLLNRLNIPGQLDEPADAPEDSEIENENGIYTLTGVGSNGLTIVGAPSSGGNDISLEISEDAGAWTYDWVEN